jgi:hypothetical protein
MARPDRYLADGEELVLGVRPHGRVLLWPFLVLLVVAAGGGAVAGATRGQPAQAQLDVLLLGLAGVLVLWWVVRPFALWWTTEYVLTTRQVLLDVPQARAVERVLAELLDGYAAGEFGDEEEDAAYDAYDVELDDVELDDVELDDADMDMDLDEWAGEAPARRRWRRR